MKTILIFAACLMTASSASAQWIKQTVNTTASFRGLSVVNESVIWASGTGGTVIRTIDGGKTWTVMTVPGAEKLDFRDIEAFEANTAYVLSIGKGESSRVYKTADGGRTWKLQFKNTNEKAFFDAIACWNNQYCMAMSDPVDGKFLLINTTNGADWQLLDTSKMPHAKEGEAAFAASGTCLITQGRNSAFIVTGGGDARVFNTTDGGKTWAVYNTAMVKGAAGSGIFSIAMYGVSDKGAIVGGDYEKPNEHTNNLAFTSDGGETWRPGTGLTGYRSGVAYIDKMTIVAVGTTGTDVTRDSGKTWKRIGDEDLNAVQAKGKNAIWAVGAKGLVVRMK
jgi:photosystem II stability/assembly factor-like uncharacterized protein